MPDPNLEAIRSQAFKVWTVVAAIVTVWMLATAAPAIIPPVAAETSGSGLFSFLSYICHQIPDRSFHFGEHQFGVCSRCFGVYFGLATGVLTYPLWRRTEDIEPLSRFWLIGSTIPMAIDWALTIFGIWENTHLTRFITGAILGAACGIYIVPAVVEIARNATSTRPPASVS